MVVKRLVPALLVVSFVFVGSTRAAAQEIVPWMTYAAFSLLDLQGRLDALNTCSPENRADLMRTHLQLWLTENSPRFSAEQIAQLEENLAFISPDLYRETVDPEVEARASELATRTRTLFSLEDLPRTLWVTGDGWTR